MKVRLTIHRPVTNAAGKTFHAQPGDVVDFPADQAVRLIQSGQADAVVETAEAAVSQPSEKAVIPSPAKSRTRKKKRS